MMKKILGAILTFAILCSSITPVLAEDYGVNLALGKTLYTEGIYMNDTSGYGVQQANDGTPEGRPTATITGTVDIRSGYSGFLLLDLGEPYEITRAVAYSRRDLNAEWARKGYMICAANNADFSDAVILGQKNSAGEFGSALDVVLKKPVVARYVFCASTSKRGGVTIGEFEVYGEPYTGKGTGDFTDLTLAAGKNASKLVFNLGIMEGVSKEELGSENLVRRDEAAMYIAKLLNRYSEDAVYGNEFEDVDAESAYAGSVSIGVSNGYISKDSNYRPDDFITVAEFSKMIIYALGNGCIVFDNESYPRNIINAGNTLKLYEDASISDTSSYLNRETAAIMMYNALIGYGYEVVNDKLEERNKTVLERIYGCKLIEGIVTGNSVTNLDEAISADDDRIEIDGVTFTDESGLAQDMLGERVFAVKNADENIVKYIWQDSTKTVKTTIDCHDISDESTIDKIKTLIDNKTKSYKLTENPYFILNGTAYAGISSASDFVSENGKVELIDFDNDGYYDVVKIYRPQIMYVDSASYDADTNEISILGQKGERVKVAPDRIKVTKSNGKSGAPDGIKSGNLVYVYVSENSKNVEIEILDEVIEGTITSNSNKYLKIDGVSYEKSDYFKRVFSSIDNGKNASFILDKNGKIVYMTDAEELKQGETISMIISFKSYPDDDMNEVVLYDESGKFTEYKLAEKPLVNGVRMSLDNMGDRSNYEGKVAIISFNSKNEISKIITSEDSEGRLSPRTESIGGAIRGVSGYYGNDTFKLIMPLNNEVKLFTLPVDENGKPHTGDTYDNLYSVTKAVNYVGLRNRVPDTSEFKMYGNDGFGVPVVAVRRVVYSDASTEYNPISKYFIETSPGFIVSGVTECYDKNSDEMYYQIEGFDVISGKKTVVNMMPGIKKYVNAYLIQNQNKLPEGAPTAGADWLADIKLIRKAKIDPYYVEDIRNLQKGDIVRYSNGSYDSTSELELISKNYDYTNADCKVVYSAGDLPNGIMATFALHQTIVSEVKDGHITFAYDDTTNQTVDLSEFTDKVIVVEGQYATAYPISQGAVQLQAGDKIKIFSSAGQYRSIIVYR